MLNVLNYDKAKYCSELHNEPIDALIEAILIANENNNKAGEK